MSGVHPSKVHKDNPQSKIRTSEKRTRSSGSSTLLIELQLYSEYFTYRFGVVNFNILDRPSNGLEMLNFFQECLTIVDPVYGNPVLGQGDIVVMDNCGFHHGAMAEPELRTMLGNNGV